MATNNLKTVTRRFKKWRDILGLNNWRLEVEELEEPEVDQASGLPHAANVTMLTRYFTAYIYPNMELLREVTDDTLDKVACHEMCHVLIADVAAYIDDVVEQLPERQRGFALERWHEVAEQTATRLERLVKELVDAKENS